MSATNVFSTSQRRLFATGILLLFLPKLINTYFLMPLPGSMDMETMLFSYWLDKTVDFFFFTGSIVVVWGSIRLISKGRFAKKMGAIFLLLTGSLFYYYTGFEMNAREMFKEPGVVSFKPASLHDYAPDAYILGVTDGDETKAYPVKYLAYHHKIQDQVNMKDILVTYCSMCRSGRVFSPFIDGEKVTFRLAGARHYNAVFEDSKSGSWWYQETGEAVAGPLKGRRLEEIQSEQTTWKAWIEKHPQTLLLQSDPGSLEKYEEWFKEFDKMRSPSDSIPENKKVWVVGVSLAENAVAYPFPVLIRKKLVQDKIGLSPVLIVIENDSLTTHVWRREVANTELDFEMDSTWNFINDKQTGSKWNMQGLCVDGFYKDKQLPAQQHYNEYLRSWMQFHPASRIIK